MMKMVWIISLVLWFSPLAQATAINWTEDVPAAETEAVEKDKLILWYFTGSDWCGFCIKLKKDVFSVHSVAQAMNTNFVTIYADYPRQKVQAPEIQKQNRKLLRRFQGLIPGYPTMIITLPDGLPVARISGGGFTAAEFESKLGEVKNEAAEVRTLIQASAVATGRIKLQTLSKLLTVATDNGVPVRFYSPYAQQLKDTAVALRSDSALDKAGRAELLLIEGLATIYLGDLKAASVLFDEAIKLSSEPWQATMDKAKLFAGAGHISGALEAAEAAANLASTPDQKQQSYFAKASYELEAGLFRNCIESARLAAEAGPTGQLSELSLLYIALGNVRLGDMKEALVAVDSALARMKTPLIRQQAFYVKGMAHQRQGEREDAIKAYESGIKEDPSTALASRMEIHVKALKPILEDE